jgi:hypothetical protein
MTELVIWLVPICTAIGLFGSWFIQVRTNGRRDGAVDEKLKAHGYRILQLETDARDHGDRIATIEGRLSMPVGAGPHRR